MTSNLPNVREWINVPIRAEHRIINSFSVKNAQNSRHLAEIRIDGYKKDANRKSGLHRINGYAT